MKSAASLPQEVLSHDLEEIRKSEAKKVVDTIPAPLWSNVADGQSVLNILSLILAGSPLSEVLTIIARLVESQGKGTLCTIWLPDEDGKHLHCAAAPSLPGFSAHVGPMCVGPKGASCGTAVYRRETVYGTDILSDPMWDDNREIL